MTRKFVLLLFLCLIPLFHKGFACEEMPSVMPHQRQTEFCEYNGQIKVFKFESGHTLVVKEVKSSPLVSVITWIKTGSVNEDDQTNGLSHFLEHLLFKGTKKFKAGEIERILESYGAYTNAATSKDFTNFEINIPSQHFAQALEFQADMLYNATIPPTELEKERKVVIEEARKAEDSPDRIVFDNMFTGLFFNHPYILKTIGTFKNIETVTREQILDYYHRWYRPNNMVTVVVGNVHTDNVVNLFENFFNTTAEQPTCADYTRETKSGFKLIADKSRDKQILEQKNVTNGYLAVSWKTTTTINDKDTYALDLLGIILGNGNSSRLYKTLYEKYSLVNSVNAWLYTMRDISLFGVEATMSPKNLYPAKNSILKIVEDVKFNGVSLSELNKAKAIIERSFVYNNESAENIASSIGYNMTIGSIEEYTNYIEKINSVTVADIQHAAQKYLVPTRSTVSILVPKDFKEVDSNQPIAMEQDNSSQDRSIIKYKLNNGLTVLVKPNDHNDVIYTSILIKGGKLSETKPGLVELFGEVLLKGTTNRSANNIAQESEENGISLSTNVDKQATYLNVKSTKQDFYKAIMLINDILRNATFPEENIVKEQQALIQDIQLKQDEPSNVAFQETDINFYPKGHPYSFEGRVLKESLPNISREDLMAYYKQFVNPHNIIITVVGNVNPLEIKEISGQIWDAQATGFEFSNKKGGKKSLVKNQEVIVEKDASTAWLILSYQAPTIDNIQDYATLKVLNTLLGGGLSSRLYNEFREKHQLSYIVGASTSAYTDLNRLSLYIGTKPSQLALVKKKFLQEMKNLSLKPMPVTELENAKNNYIGKFIMQHETNANQAFYLSFYESVGLGYEFDAQFSDIVASITPQDVQRVVKKYFAEPVLTVVVADPVAAKQYKKETH